MKRIALLAVALLVCGSTLSRAVADCYQHCGCSANCSKVCRCIPDIKKVPKTTYTCECEDFCVPGPSEHCVVCDECGNKQHVFTPTCAKVHTRKRPVKHETVQEVKTYKWVVVNLCPTCCARSEQSELPAEGSAQSAAVAAEQQVSYHAPASEATSAEVANSAGTPSLKSQLRRMLQPVLGRESSSP